MSTHHEASPSCSHHQESSTVELTISGRSRSIGAFDVRRSLPSSKRRAVGPFVFFDEMGPAVIPAGDAMDVRPHPHINLATVTYLFEGRIDHRDSLGSHQAIEPGAINWMVAGRGIVHSERSTDEDRERDQPVHGIQLWVGLPQADEETDPSFQHHPASTIPELEQDGVELRILLGEAYGHRSPVAVLSPMFYVEAKLPPGASLSLPDYPERALYPVEGSVRCGSDEIPQATMAVFREGEEVTISSAEGARVMLLGGDPLDGERTIWWNFVSSRPERIEEAKHAWQNNMFPVVPGDESERIPLPQD